MARATIIVITGPPGSGKTALAARLHDRLGWTVLAKDTIKEALFDALGTGDRAWSRTLSDASYELVFRLARHGMGRDRLLVLEGNFRAEHWPRIEELVSSRGAALLVVALDSDREVLKRRLEARAADADRHPGHLDRELITEISHVDGMPEDRAASAASALARAAQRIDIDTSVLDGGLLDFIAEDLLRRIAADVPQAV